MVNNLDPNATIDTIPDECAICTHPEVSHVKDEASGQGVCQRCMARAALRVGMYALVHHDYESRYDRMRTYLKQSRMVVAIAVDTDIVVSGRHYVVAAPCPDVADGFWLCVTHQIHFIENMDKDIHCYRDKDARELHRMVWVCWQHGPEMGTDDGSPEMTIREG